MRKELVSESLFVTALLIFVAGCANAQPFGIPEGTSISNLNVEKEFLPGKYFVQAKKPHPEFEKYVAVATPETGVCMIRGYGQMHKNDSHGLAIRERFGTVRQQVASIYGVGTFYDQLVGNQAIWKANNEWVMAILKSERVYQVAWTRESSKNMPNNVSEILLTVEATNRETSYLTLQFAYDNYGKCDQIQKNMASNAFK